MKKQMLKIAGVKSEKEFYKKFPTEEAFMAKHGKELKKAQIGTYMTSEAAPTVYNPIDTREMYDQIDYQVTGMTDAERRQLAALQSAQTGIDITGTMSGPQLAPTAQNLQQQQFNWGTDYDIPKQPSAPSSKKNKIDASKALPVIGEVIGGIQNIKQQKKRYKEAQQQTALTDVMAKAAASRPLQQPRRQYVRPEDVIIQPEQMFPSYGVGTNVLAQDGTEIGGTPTEIQNMYNPGTLYSDLGYEPLNDISKMKQFQAGGGLAALNSSQVGQVMGSAEGQQLANIMGGGQTGGWSNVLGGVGGLAGGPVGFMARFMGSAIDRTKEKKIENQQRLAQENISNIIGQSFGMGLQNQFGSYMQDGGETSSYKWMSHTWQPQVITTFGEHKLKDLLTPPDDADMLRAGGHLKAYTPPSPRALSTERPEMQEGGELQTHWGGYAEPISYNPYLPDGGETIMFRGQSHDESDGQGNTGIGITFGENPVEVERGEPAVKLQDGTTGDSNLTVFGNIKITNAFADMLADPKAKGKKFKSYVADLSKQENKQNKLVEKSINQLDNLDVQTSFDKLALETLQANIEGANAKLKDLATKKMDAAALQNAINDTKEEDLLEVTDKGDVLAKKGASIPKAQKGLTARADVPKQARTNFGYGNITRSNIEQMKINNPWYDWSTFNPASAEDVLEFQQAFNRKAEEMGSPSRLQEDSKLGQQTVSARGLYGDNRLTPLPRIATPNLGYTLPTPSATPTKTKVSDVSKTKTQNPLLAAAISQALNYLRPSDVEQLDPNQLIGEMYALSQNQVEPVWAQKIQPQLSTPMDISLQDILNQNQADYNATQRMVGYNPAALGALNAQKYQANQRVLGEQFRMNQAEKQRVYEQNRNLLNQANLQNLQTLERQADKQATALSKTKATTQEALNSIAAKYAQNKLENRTLAVYENLYNYRYDPNFRLQNMQLAQFNIPTAGTVPATEKKAKTGKAIKKSNLNSSIVKGLKNI